jgi:hypothetical protein
MKLHPGIQISHIPVKGAAGLIFVIGTLLPLLIGLPEVRIFFLIAAAGGLVMAVLLRLTH